MFLSRSLAALFFAAASEAGTGLLTAIALESLGLAASAADVSGTAGFFAADGPADGVVFFGVPESALAFMFLSRRLADLLCAAASAAGVGFATAAGGTGATGLAGSAAGSDEVNVTVRRVAIIADRVLFI